MRISYQEDLWLGDDSLDERMAGARLARKLFRGVDGRVDLAMQGISGRLQCLKHSRKTDRADDHYVDVAARALLAARDRAIDKGSANAPIKR
jgi:hypothetical protein